MRDEIIKLARSAYDSVNTMSTWFYDLERKDGKRWAIVFAWMDWDNTDEWRFCGKVAYQPTNSMMQEYDIDWLMPTTDDGECDDTETGITSLSLEADVDWLLKEWERVRKEYVDGNQID